MMFVWIRVQTRHKAAVAAPSAADPKIDDACLRLTRIHAEALSQRQNAQRGASVDCPILPAGLPGAEM